ncbi:MAG: transposase [bacterium]
MKAFKDIRLPHYNYSLNGWYFVTICTHSRLPLLSGRTGDEISHFINSIPATETGLSIDYFVVMPNHVHLILVLENTPLKLGEIIRRFKARTSRHFNRRLWQPNYYEHVIRDENALTKIREYITNNPDAEKFAFEQFYKTEKAPHK